MKGKLREIGGSRTMIRKNLLIKGEDSGSTSDFKTTWK